MLKLSLEQCAQNVGDGDVIAVTGNGGGMLEPDAIFAALESRFLSTGHPRDLTIVHALGIGDGQDRGISRFAHEGMVKRVIGGHWSWSPRMQQLALKNRIEAFTLPSGVISLLLRESGAHRPGLITHVGLNTAFDPRKGGGASNESAKLADPLSEIVRFDGKEYIRYFPLRPNVAIVRGTYCDEFGNLSCSEEAGDLDITAVALSARNSGGQVMAQVREVRQSKDCHARLVQVPGALIDFVSVVPDQPQTHVGGYEPSLAGLPRAETPTSASFEGMSMPRDARAIIARRAADEVKPGLSVNFGFGIPGGIAAILTTQGRIRDVWISVEQGTHNGQLIDGPLFGAAEFPNAIMRSTDQFDYYSGGGADLAFLGAGEIDAAGNVNVSRLGQDVVGPGGFVDISQCAKHVVFCGTFEAGGLQVSLNEGQLRIDSPGRFSKFVEHVRETTFSGTDAINRGKNPLYITERAVFRLTGQGLELIEVAPGIDVRRDVLDRMAFQPHIAEHLALMPAHCFLEDATIDAQVSAGPKTESNHA